MDIRKKVSQQLVLASILLLLDIAYLALVASTFIFHLDLATNMQMQYMLHITVILSAFAYLFFAQMIYRTEGDTANGRMALLFAALFTLPILIGRGIGLFAISQNATATNTYLFNFYATVSVSRIEIVSWTTLFPLSVLFLAKLFIGQEGKLKKFLAVLCALSSLCCFIAFMTIISPNMLYLWIGLAGWGALFLLIIIVYILTLLKPAEK